MSDSLQACQKSSTCCMALCVLTWTRMKAISPQQKKQIRPLYPIRPIPRHEVQGELLFAYGRLFARGPDGRWHLVETTDD